MLRIKNAILGDSGTTDTLPTVTEGEPTARDQLPALLSPSLSIHQDNTPVQGVPHWLRELNRSRAMRHSRASSIVSTRTKFSTTTLQEDAQSIDINVAGQYFRISRDGSRITVDEPPPYTGPGVTVRFGSGQTTPVSRTSALSEDIRGDDDNLSETEDGATTPRSTIAHIGTEILVGANILDPSEFEMPSPVGPDQLTHRSSTRTLVGSERQNALNDSELSQNSDESQGDERWQERTPTSRTNLPPLRAPTVHSLPATPSRRMRLPALVTSNSTGTLPTSISRPSSQRSGNLPALPETRSAGPVLFRSQYEREPRSPDYIGQNARGIFPPTHGSSTVRATTFFNVPREIEVGGGLRTGRSDIESASGSYTPLSMDTENDISMHYARMMRKLDYAHRKALHLKDKELAEMRERLHEKDTVLRQQLRAKDFMIDDLKQRLSNLEENVEVMLEKARNQVEDLWECRWKDRDFHLRERMRRIEEEAQKVVDNIKPRNAKADAQDASKPSIVAT
ncbi:hypothetical protein LTR84_002131 [Exophiala bonariae]|uniref:Uncharacterized protein n=1 Tax=Exophiala bonariae TaxID=1690606 RepID=A0AAV9NAM7_9EURO|nr:hypothetical protein LTR84_002131 [Exophiala bonariae]